MNKQPADGVSPQNILSPTVRVLSRVLRGLRSAWVIGGITILMLLCFDYFCGRIVNKLTPKEKSGKTAEYHWIHDPDFGAQEWGPKYAKESKAADVARWEPYVYWRRKAFSGELINIDGRGIRRTANNATTAPRSQIAMFGGSTLWGTGARDAHTIPSELAALFSKEGVPVEITNFGEAGYVQTQEVISLLRALHNGYRPKLVIFYDGVNDVYSAYQSGVAGIPQNEDHRQREFGLGRPKMSLAIQDRLANSGIMRLIGYLKFGSKEAIKAAEHAARNPQELAGQVIQTCHCNIQAIDALAKQFGFDAVCFWQPTLFSKNRLSAPEKRIAQDNPPLKELYDAAYNQVTVSQLAKQGRFFNLADVFSDVEKSVFLDYCHVSEFGNARIAQAIFANLKKLQLVR